MTRGPRPAGRSARDRTPGLRSRFERGDLPNIERALREGEAAANEAAREVAWYEMYMRQTCRYDEATAYEAGIEVCDTAEARTRCNETGETAVYDRTMGVWRRFMQNPPNCPALPRRPRAP